MRKITLLFIAILSFTLLTSCFDINGGGTKTPTVDTTPVISEYTVTFMDGDEIYKTYTVQEGNKVNKPTNPTKEGFGTITLCPNIFTIS